MQTIVTFLKTIFLVDLLKGLWRVCVREVKHAHDVIATGRTKLGLLSNSSLVRRLV